MTVYFAFFSQINLLHIAGIGFVVGGIGRVPQISLISLERVVSCTWSS
jgi:hypothetical protein